MPPTTAPGELLRKERENRKIPLDEVARETRISVRYLEALEKSEFSELPGTVFNKGYVRTYARYLGLDAGRLVEAYVEEEAEQARDGRVANGPDVIAEMSEKLQVGGPARGGGTGAASRSSGLIVMVGAVIVGVSLVGLAAWWLAAKSGSEPDVAAGGADVAGTHVARAGGGARIDDATGRGSAPPPPSQQATVSPQTPPGGVSESAASATPRIDPPAGARDEGRTARDSKTLTREPAPERTPAARSAPAEPDHTPTARETARAATAPAGTTPAAVEGRGPLSPPAPPTPSAEGRLSISESGVGARVVNRQLRGESDEFAEGAVVHFWTRVIGGRSGDSIRHVWLRGGDPIGVVTLNIGGSHWRTHSRRVMREGYAGPWAVEARDADGRVLARHEFDVTRPPGS